MDDLLLHPRTRAELLALLHDAPHGLLFAAPHGTGKLTIARRWAQQLAKNAAIGVLSPDEKGTITIEATRALYQQTRAKQDGWQVVIIDHAEAMSGEAQNAFLKLLEEPRPQLAFILLVANADAMLPTILSRVQTVHVMPTARAAMTTLARTLTPEIDEQTLNQQLFVADGRPATLVNMQEGDQAFVAAREVMQRAKQLLSAPLYERLCTVQELSKDRTVAITTLEAMARMLQLQIMHDTTSVQLFNVADALQDCLARLKQNGNVRAQLTRLFTAY